MNFLLKLGLFRMDNMFLFAEPVTDEIAPLYSTMIKKPMDFSTITNKINSNCYFNIEDFKVYIIVFVKYYI
jgi:bromodomain-containing protein 7/9